MAYKNGIHWLRNERKIRRFNIDINKKQNPITFSASHLKCAFRVKIFDCRQFIFITELFSFRAITLITSSGRVFLYFVERSLRRIKRAWNFIRFISTITGGGYSFYWRIIKNSGILSGNVSVSMAEEIKGNTYWKPLMRKVKFENSRLYNLWGI